LPANNPRVADRPAWFEGIDITRSMLNHAEIRRGYVLFPPLRPRWRDAMTTVNDPLVESDLSVPVTDEEIFRAHDGGKLDTAVTRPIADPRTLSIVYTPGVAKVSRAIAEDASLAGRYTWTNRLVAVVSDGTAVLGLGNIGPRAALPVMEGKSALFKTFGGLNSIPLVLDTTDVDEIVETLVRLRPSFGAVNLEDVAAPRCFELERRLIEALDCPVMHDDQHGTAIVLLAALRGANAVLDRPIGNERIVIAGAGASGIACANFLLSAGAGDVVVVDSRGIVHEGREGLNPVKAELATRSNTEGLRGGLAEADPEIHPEVARRHAAIVATGRSDFPNQINNSLAFPGVFRGALDAGARRITERMKMAAADAIAAVAAEDLAADHIVPSGVDPRVAPEVAAAVARAAKEDGVA
jgi:malate dehydrogenase (oxaloacetate-decarboxylating)